MDNSVVFLERDGSAVVGATQLGSKYLLGKQLGRGAMGVVYEATTTDGASLAIKLLRPELACDDKTVARFVQERQIFRRISHPNVVRVDDLVAEGDQLGIAMEKVSGGDLRRRAEARSLTPRAAMQIAADVAAGLEAIHAADVVHRDLKPANILIAETPEGLQPKISDFGISRLVSEAMTRTSTTIGTPLYMAPEAADRRGADAPADVYSLGAMMFELLIGTAPFHEGGTFAVLRAHAQDAPPFIAGVPTELSDLVDEMLAKEPASRPTAAVVRQRLLEIVPLIDDAQHSPIAIERTAGAGDDSGATMIAAGNDSALHDSADTRISPAGALAGAVMAYGYAADGGPSTSNPGTGGAPTESNAFANRIPAGYAVDGAGSSPAGPAPGVPAGAASKAGEGRRSSVLNRLPRGAGEVGLALASLVALIAVVGFVAARGGDESAIGSEGGTVVDGRVGADIGAPDIGAPDIDAPPSGNQSEGSDNGGRSMIFDPTETDSDKATADTTARSSNTASSNGSAGNPSNNKTSSTGQATPTTNATTTSGNPTTSKTQTTPTTPTTPTTQRLTTTTKPVTTTEQITTTTGATTTTAPAAVPIRIVSGPSVDSVGPTSFHFNYSTNDVCGSGSFTVTERDTGTYIGSFSGGEVCYGPLHGGFPQASHATFGGYIMEPNTAYRVSVTVRGTASDGTKTAGSGSDSLSFDVTTAAG